MTQTQLIAIQAEQQREKLRSERITAVLRALGRSLLNTLITLVIVIGLWQLIVSFGGISPYVAKGPMDVWQFLFVDEPDVRPDDTAAIHRTVLAGLLLATLQDAALGFVVGMAIAIVLAVSFSLSRTVEASVMPLALLLRTIPLVSIAPGDLPAHRTRHGGVRRRHRNDRRALPGARLGAVRAQPREQREPRPRVGLRRRQPHAAAQGQHPGRPARRCSPPRGSRCPGAVTGALLAEWLSTGAGIGGSIVKFSASARFDDLWASVALITFVTLLLYNVVQILENLVLARMGMTRTLQ